MNFQDLCAPAIVNVILSVLGLISAFYNGFRLRFLFLSGLVVLFWTWLLNKLCEWGYRILAWIIVLFPFIIIGIVLLVFLVFYLTGDKKKDDEKK